MTASVVQFFNGTEDNSSGLTALIPATGSLAVTVGNRLHVIVISDNTAATQIVTSVPSQVWTPLDNVLDVSDGDNVQHFVSDALASSSIVITCTFNALAGARAFSGKEITGSSGYDSVAGAHAGQLQTAPAATANAVTSGNTPALTSQPALVSGFCFAESISSATPAIGTTLSFASDGTGWSFGGTASMRSESGRTTSTAATAATFTRTKAVGHITVAAVFLEAASALRQRLTLLGAGT